MEASLALAAVGATLVFAFAAGQIFRRHRIPDIPLLLGLGGILGPLLGVVDVEAAAAAMPFLAALALVMVLFDGAMEVTPGALRSHGRSGLFMAIAAFTITTLVCGAIGFWVAGLPASVSILLGMCFGGAGIVIIIPMAKRLDVSAGAMTVVLMEAVVSDIFVIIAVTSSVTVLLAGSVDAGIVLPFVRALAVGTLVGAPTGWLWGRLVTRGRTENAYGVTIAVLLLVYAAAESLGGSGPLAVLLFGLLVGDAMRHMKMKSRRVLDAQLIDFHQEAMFFVRAFFFVGVGVISRWELLLQPAFLAVGLLLTVGVAASRASAVALTLRADICGWDRTAVALLFPMGLVTAASSLLPQAAGVPGTEILDEYAAVVIVLTNIVAAVAVPAAVRMRPRSDAAHA